MSFQSIFATAEFLRNSPWLSSYNYAPNLSAFLSITPILILLISLWTRRKLDLLLSVFFFWVVSLLAAFSRGGGDFTYYTRLFHEDILLSYAEPFWRVYYFFYSILSNYINKEILLSVSLFGVAALFFLPFIYLKRQQVLPSLLLSYSLYGYALPLAQVRLSVSVSFFALYCICQTKKQKSLSFLFLFGSIISHTTALIIVPFMLYLSSLDYLALYNQLKYLKLRLKSILAILLILLFFTIGIAILATRYLFFGEVSAIAVGAAGSSLTKDIVFSSFLMAPLMIDRRVNSFRLRKFSSLTAEKNIFGVQLFNLILIPLSIFGWMARLRFWGLYVYVTGLSERFPVSSPVYCALILLLSLRNLFLVSNGDPGFSYFWFDFS